MRGGGGRGARAEALLSRGLDFDWACMLCRWLAGLCEPCCAACVGRRQWQARCMYTNFCPPAASGSAPAGHHEVHHQAGGQGGVRAGPGAVCVWAPRPGGAAGAADDVDGRHRGEAAAGGPRRGRGWRDLPKCKAWEWHLCDPVDFQKVRRNPGSNLLNSLPKSLLHSPLLCACAPPRPR